ncbi:14479_t:CDS:1, partial [Funneliformis geosporum]
VKVNINRLTIDELKQKLKDYDIDTTDINNRVVLVGILQSRLDNMILKRNK